MPTLLKVNPRGSGGMGDEVLQAIVGNVGEVGIANIYRDVQLDFTPEMKVFYMMLERCHAKNRKRSHKQHTKYFNFWCKIHLDHPVQSPTKC